MKIGWFVHALDTPLGRKIVREYKAAAAESGFPELARVTWAQPGEFEDRTLNWAQDWSQHNPDGMVLYMHTKGAYRSGMQKGLDTQALWRQAMTDRLLCAWPARIEELRDHDTSGVWWLFGEYYAGNFWWARADYLTGLPRLPRLTAETRGEAESWLRKGNPRVKYMSTEWPSFMTPDLSL